MIAASIHSVPRSLGTVCSIAGTGLSTNAALGESLGVGGVNQVEFAVVAAKKLGSAITNYTVRVVTSRDGGSTWQAVATRRDSTGTTAASHTFTPTATAARDTLIVTGPIAVDRMALEVTADAAGDTGDIVTATARMLG